MGRMMKIIYLDCAMGAAGDMLTAALLELAEDKEQLISKLNNIGIPNVTVSINQSIKCGIVGTHLNVLVKGIEEQSHDYEHGQDGHKHEHNHDHEHKHEHNHDHEHTHISMQDIQQIIFRLEVPENVKKDAYEVYKIVAEAESRVHGKSVEEVHFHEVGMMDAIMDIVGCALLIDQLKVDKIIASYINVGFGQVKCAHGILPVPAPATANILHGIPCYSGSIRGELCTPTGAALLKYFVQEYTNMPPMIIENIGYGMGKKDFEAANCVRAMIGELQHVEKKEFSHKHEISENGIEEINIKNNANNDIENDINNDIKNDAIIELSCNMDDITPEEIGYATQILLQNGALDVYTTSIGMKKSRPGILLSVMCKENEREKMTKLLFKHTTTIGIREYKCERMILERTEKVMSTSLGHVRVKETQGFGVKRAKMEYEDLQKIAEVSGFSIREIKEQIQNEVSGS